MDSLPIGRIDDHYRNGELLLVPPVVRRKHMAIFGAAGAGKTALLRNMVAWNTRCGPLTPPPICYTSINVN